MGFIGFDDIVLDKVYDVVMALLDISKVFESVNHSNATPFISLSEILFFILIFALHFP